MTYPEGEIRTLPPEEQQKYFGKEVFVVSRAVPQGGILKRKLSNITIDEISWWVPHTNCSKPIRHSGEIWMFFPNYWMAYKHWLKLKNEVKP